MPGNEYNRNPLEPDLKPLCQFNPVHEGHINIDQSQMLLVPLCFLECLLSISRLTADLEAMAFPIHFQTQKITK
ncbi:hypothetical protein D3C72_2423280 [compost metagenome]